MALHSASYVPLWCKSHYSFLEGASDPAELVSEAHRMGLPGLALTDRDGVYGAVRAHVRARELDFPLIQGAQVSIDDGSQIMLLAQSRKGWAQLCQLLSVGRLRCAKGRSQVSWSEVAEHSTELIALWGGRGSALLAARHPDGLADVLRDAFGDRLYAYLTRHRESREQREERLLRQRAIRYGLATVAGSEVLYHLRGRRALQDVLTCIRHGATLATAGRRIHPNDERVLHAPEAFAVLYADDLESVRRSCEVAARCDFSLAQIHYRYPSEQLPDGRTSHDHLRDLTRAGAKKRYPRGVPFEVSQQLEKELAVIGQLEYDGYFLTMYEIVRECRRRGILAQGRGSAANSAVCYCLDITAVDPVRMGLLFERFLSVERAEPPDIDLDIEHDRREEIIQFVYEKYGRQHAAMVANFIRYRSRSAVREVGKVLGIPETTVDRLSRMMSHYGDFQAETLVEAGLDPMQSVHQSLLRLTNEIQDVPRHLSIHPGGFLLGHEPVHSLVPIENASMEGRTVIQWDKEDIEDLNLFKVDLLGLGALNVLHRCFDHLRESRGIQLELADIPIQDEDTFDLMCAGDTMGVFQVESRAQMSMLPRLRPRHYYDLVIEISIVRPGPISGGMVHPYLRRRQGLEEVSYPHPSLEPVLKRTLGIPIFQEQVMRLAIVAADYTPGEADQLRRDMAAWKQSGRIERHRDRLITRMMQKGIAREFAEQVFQQILGFGEYGFPESHAASFALLAYATAWMKCHQPAVFLCALLNAQPMGFYNPATLIEDAKRHGVQLAPIDVRTSHWDCTLEQQGTGAADRAEFAVRMGMRYIKGVHRAQVERLLAARAQAPWTSLQDLAQRARLDEGVLTRFAEAGALAAFSRHRRDALWRTLATPPARDSAGAQLEFEARDAPANFAELDAFEQIEWDHESSSHSTQGHPLGRVREELSRQGIPDALHLRQLEHGSEVHYAGVVICRQRPGTAGGVVFMTLEDETGLVNAVLWDRVYQEHRVLAKTQSFLGITGTIQSEAGVVHLIAKRLWAPQVLSKPQSSKSRDFH